MQRLSVLIANYNYERFVGEAIESALAVEWDDVEVVVVDDGSTDGSRDVIERYADRIKILLTDNGTQRVATNRGFPLTTGDVVIFLDSDDLLPPDVAARLAAVWSPAVSKAQFRAQRIDADGAPLGQPYPRYHPVPTPQDIRRWARRTTAYPTASGSGNAYARWFLERILPAGPSLGNASDSGPLAAAPFLGDVVTVPEVVIRYRRHGDNDSNLVVDITRFSREVIRARERWRFAHQAAGADQADERALFRSRELLQLRVAALRLTPGEPGLPGDGRRRMLLDALRSPWQIGPEPLLHRMSVLAWSLATLLAPAPQVRWLLDLRYGRNG